MGGKFLVWKKTGRDRNATWKKGRGKQSTPFHWREFLEWRLIGKGKLRLEEKCVWLGSPKQGRRENIYMKLLFHPDWPLKRSNIAKVINQLDWGGALEIVLEWGFRCLSRWERGGGRRNCTHPRIVRGV